MSSSQLSVGSLDKEEPKSHQQQTTETRPLATPIFVGRDAELGRLQAAFARARQGERQMVLISGEAGIGKTALVERFLDQVRTTTPLRIARGQCIELYGPGRSLFTVAGSVGSSYAASRVGSRS